MTLLRTELTLPPMAVVSVEARLEHVTVYASGARVRRQVRSSSTAAARHVSAQSE